MVAPSVFFWKSSDNFYTRYTALDAQHYVVYVECSHSIANAWDAGYVVGHGHALIWSFTEKSGSMVDLVPIDIMKEYL